MARVLVAGCGYLGQAAARLFHRGGYDVVGLVHSNGSAGRLAHEKFPVLRADLADRETLNGLPGPFDAVVHCAAPGESTPELYRAVYLEGAKHLRAAFPAAKLLFTGSTSVYAQQDGSVVTEESPAEPKREMGRILRETEEFVLGNGGFVARLSGLYGPKRSVLLRKFLEGTAAIEGDGSRYVNQIHRDDAAGAIFYLIAWHCAPGIYNVTDDAPVTQYDLYAWMAEHFRMPLPPYGPIEEERKRGVTNKRVSNAKLHALGWKCRYPSFQTAVAEIAAGLVSQGRALNVLRPAARLVP